jgi:tRNA(Ile)-lysidine synthase
MSGPQALSAVEFAALMTALPTPEPGALAVAVSGGPDSMALTLLLSAWAQTYQVQLQAFTIDHALRPESAAEATQVGQWCAALGVPHEILRWEHAGVTERLQEQARTARYDLLAAACRRHGIATLALAHHLDDQAETVLLRFAKGSGIDGLAGMRVIGTWGDAEPVSLFRPLLVIPKSRLIATCAARRQEYVCDPGNETPRFARGRLRAAMPALAAEGLDAVRLSDLAARAGLASAALAEYTRRLLTRAARYDAAGYAELNLRLCQEEPAEIQARALTMVLRHIGGAMYAPKHAALLEAMATWQEPEPPRRTLQGCEIAVRDGVCRVIREYAAITDRLLLAPGQSVVWDRRFRVSLTTVAPENLTVRTLGVLTHDQTDAIAPGLRQKIGMGRVRATMPALFNAQTLVGIPGYGNVAAYATVQPVTPYIRG